ncbi:hypothetical protein BY996DRAFT_6504491 [Phakopsora pachyrhizi]|nr:hypothetical protein BY996DRAFT_6504491 [Phakopsora pachyrhizi]
MDFLPSLHSHPPDLKASIGLPSELTTLMQLQWVFRYTNQVKLLNNHHPITFHPLQVINSNSQPQQSSTLNNSLNYICRSLHHHHHHHHSHTAPTVPHQLTQTVFRMGGRTEIFFGLDDELEDKPIKKIKSKRQSSVIVKSSTKKVWMKASSNNGNLSNLLSINSQHTSNTTIMMGTSNCNSLTPGTSECSFNLNYERLIKFISDLESFEPYWITIKVIDLGSRRLENVIRLKDILPFLDQIDL